PDQILEPAAFEHRVALAPSGHNLNNNKSAAVQIPIQRFVPFKELRPCSAVAQIQRGYAESFREQFGKRAFTKTAECLRRADAGEITSRGKVFRHRSAKA